MSKESHPRMRSLYGKSGLIAAAGLTFIGAKKLGMDIIGDQKENLSDYLMAYGSFLMAATIPIIRAVGRAFKDPSLLREIRDNLRGGFGGGVGD
ncbi:hypothetical protein HYT32_02445 [Candidatus Roizmanbacteria bacterium]|nr:hypothetical protein [Candidatus Roizmanbacteria bacterium]